MLRKTPPSSKWRKQERTTGKDTRKGRTERGMDMRTEKKDSKERMGTMSVETVGKGEPKACTENTDGKDERKRRTEKTQ